MIRTSITAVLAAAACLAACERDDIHAYRAPKAAPAPAAGQQMPAPMPGAGQAQAQVTWDVPEGWRTVQSEQAMRIATFKAGPGDGVEVSVTAFPGDVGGLLANVNRWRGQVGLPPAQEADLPKLVKTVKGQSGDVSILDFAGSAGQQLLAAIVQPGDGKSWFVKASGTPEAVGAVRESFEKFAQSIRMGPGAASPAPSPAANAPMGAPMAGPGAPPIAPSQASGAVADRLSAWTPPAGWARDTQASGIVAAAYNVAGAQGSARVTATSLFGDGGGTLMNINRWRNQLSLPEVADLSQQPSSDLGAGAMEVDLVDPGKTQRMVAVILSSQDQTWFFKMTGAPASLEAQKPAFEQFVRSVGLGGH